MLKILVIDGQGGGVGKALVEQLKQRLPAQPLIALGVNAVATMAMLKAGADQGATGENAIAFNCRDADIILGPIGILMANAMLGELTPAIAEAVGSSRALKVLIPIGKCRIAIAGLVEVGMNAALADAVELVARAAREAEAHA